MRATRRTGFQRVCSCVCACVECRLFAVCVVVVVVVVVAGFVVAVVVVEEKTRVLNVERAAVRFSAVAVDCAAAVVLQICRRRDARSRVLVYECGMPLGAGVCVVSSVC